MFSEVSGNSTTEFGSTAEFGVATAFTTRYCEALRRERGDELGLVREETRVPKKPEILRGGGGRKRVAVEEEGEHDEDEDEDEDGDSRVWKLLETYEEEGVGGFNSMADCISLYQIIQLNQIHQLQI